LLLLLLLLLLSIGSLLLLLLALLLDCQISECAREAGIDGSNVESKGRIQGLAVSLDEHLSGNVEVQPLVDGFMLVGFEEFLTLVSEASRLLLRIAELNELGELRAKLLLNVGLVVVHLVESNEDLVVVSLRLLLAQNALAVLLERAVGRNGVVGDVKEGGSLLLHLLLILLLLLASTLCSLSRRLLK
jgi:hypothetical protein